MSLDVEKYVKSVEREYDFPTGLQFNSYHEPSRGCDVVQVYFRYSPFDDGNGPVGDKFGFEIVTDNGNISDKDALKDMKKREVHDALTAMEGSWKAAFNYVFWQDIPYAINEQDRAFTVKCEVCHSARSIDKPGDFEYRRDLYLIYLLKEIDHDCSDGWEAAGYDKDLSVMEGAHFVRSGSQT
jgi:hypothetical protein